MSRQRRGVGERAHIALSVAVGTLIGVFAGRLIERRRMLASAAKIALTDPLTGLAFAPRVKGEFGRV